MVRKGMTLVPGGVFRMGSAAFYPEEGPVTTIRVDSVWVDDHPVTNAAFRRFVAGTGHVTVAETAPTLVISPALTRSCWCPAHAIAVAEHLGHEWMPVTRLSCSTKIRKTAALPSTRSLLGYFRWRSDQSWARWPWNELWDEHRPYLCAMCPFRAPMCGICAGRAERTKATVSYLSEILAWAGPIAGSVGF